jgi:hypothetical protein
MLPGVDRYIEELPEKSRPHRSRPHAQYVKVTRGAACLGRTGLPAGSLMSVFFLADPARPILQFRPIVSLLFEDAPEAA